MIPAWIRGAVVLSATLGAGVIIGVSYERRRVPIHVSDGTQAHHVMHRLSDHLGLDSAQQVAIAAIFARRQGVVDSTWHAVQPHVRAVLDSTLREILIVLRPDQADKYREMVEKMHPGTFP